MSEDKFLWKTNDGLVDISEMRTSHIINAIYISYYFQNLTVYN